MPIMKCNKDGKSGYKYGESGHCYTGPDAKKKAAKQGQAIEISKHSKGEAVDKDGIDDILLELSSELSLTENVQLSLARNSK